MQKTDEQTTNSLLDGWMARKYNQVTEMGKLMDPIADKLLTCGALVVAAAFGEFGNVTQIVIYVALLLFLYSGAIYLINTFRKPAA